jgi:hypothetical protein
VTNLLTRWGTPFQSLPKADHKDVVKTLATLSATMLLLLVSGCRTNHYLYRSTRLTVEEDALLKENWRVAHMLADYDSYGRIASDSLLAYAGTLDTNRIQGHVAIVRGNSATVIFGALDSSGLQSAFEVEFLRDKTSVLSRPEKSYGENKEPYRRFVALHRAREASRASIGATTIPYDSYVLRIGDSLYVYFIPGSRGQKLGMGGGIRTIVDARDLRILDSKLLHESPLVITAPPPGAVAMKRTSSLTVVPNEVDLAQTIFYKNFPVDQIIVTQKYTFVFAWDKSLKEVSTDIVPEGIRK